MNFWLLNLLLENSDVFWIINIIRQKRKNGCIGLIKRNTDSSSLIYSMAFRLFNYGCHISQPDLIILVVVVGIKVTVNDGVPSVCVGVAVPILCGGVHVILLRSVLLPRPDDANEPELFTVDSYSG
ncbi:hypothetical protein DERP_004114 [Dermatophagoides pteronyssinus]|uniref:Uncharacterized protein n=1 Tax=Dermatophagoides pteronyssinus TaxID=6956 RepID=A0ABQ8J8B3_DERPT|nr:hypothetical protein DERP_004114 [Dermatophagoides pteronyssinus]